MRRAGPLRRPDAPPSAPHVRQFVTEHQSGAVVSPTLLPMESSRLACAIPKRQEAKDGRFNSRRKAKAKAIRRFC